MFKNSSLKGIRYIAPAAFVLTSLSLSGCGDDPLGIDEATSCSVAAELNALSDSVTALGDLSAKLELDLTTACNAIATADGRAEGADVGAACAEAKATIDAAFTGSASAFIEITPGYCTVDASAQLGCEAGCDVSADCDVSPGAIEARCTPGEFSVACEGSCEGSAYCEGSASASVNCEGSCQGTCEGSCTVELTAAATCDGNCNGTCDGNTSDGAACAGECKGSCELTGSAAASCSGSCEGSCSGRCEFAADASIECNAEVRCDGECTGTASLPECDVQMDPPKAECNVDAECQASCEANASVAAECVAPAVTISAEAGLSVELKAALEAQLPIILGIGANVELLVGAAADIPGKFIAVVQTAATLPACAGILVGDIKAQAEASVDISVSVSASASASGSVAGSAGG